MCYCVCTWMKSGNNFISSQSVAQFRFEYPGFFQCEFERVVFITVDGIMLFNVLTAIKKTLLPDWISHWNHWNKTYWKTYGPMSLSCGFPPFCTSSGFWISKMCIWNSSGNGSFKYILRDMDFGLIGICWWKKNKQKNFTQRLFLARNSILPISKCHQSMHRRDKVKEWVHQSRLRMILLIFLDNLYFSLAI